MKSRGYWLLLAIFLVMGVAFYPRFRGAPPPRTVPNARVAPAAPNDPSAPASADVAPTTRAVLPELTAIVPDWRDYNPASLTIAPHPDLPVTYQRTSSYLNERFGRRIWVGRNALNGSFLVTSATRDEMAVVLSIPGADTYEFRVTNRGTTVHQIPMEGETCDPHLPVALATPPAPNPAASAVAGSLNGTAEVTWESPSPAAAAASGEALSVDVAVFYNVEALAEAGSEISLLTLVLARFEAANQVLLQSAVTHFRWTVVSCSPVPVYPTTALLIDDLNTFSLSNTEVGKVALAESIAAGADQSLLLVGGKRDWAGLANMGGYYSAIYFSQASYYTIAHELAHNFGCNHDRVTAGAKDGNGAYNYGYTFDTSQNTGGTPYVTTNGTIMSYKGMRLGYFSNPTLTYLGQPLGVPLDQPLAAYNAKTLADAAPGLAAHRAPPTRPRISTAPKDATVVATDSVSFTVVAAGPAPFSYQWRKDGLDLPGATSATLTLSHPLAADAGAYSVVVTGGGISVTSDSATLTVTPRESAKPGPASDLFVYMANNLDQRTLRWTASTTGGIVTGYKLERALDAGFTIALVTYPLGNVTEYIDSITPGCYYFYRLAATNTNGASATITCRSATSALQPLVTKRSRLVNIATRAYCSTGNKVTIGGFVVSGTASKSVLVRAIGPSLMAQGLSLSEVLQNPTIEVHDASHGNATIATNDDWASQAAGASAAAITSTASAIGASALLPGDTTSAALLLTLSPGVYSFVVEGKSAASGIVLLEVYDADATDNGSKFVNIATRANATTGNGVTIGGFVISGASRKNVLLRAVGASLVTQGLSPSEILLDPTIELHDATQGNAIIAINQNWFEFSNPSEVTAAGNRVGATPLDSTDTKSSALYLTLKPGVYSFVASGTAGGTGVVLVEVYDAD